MAERPLHAAATPSRAAWLPSFVFGCCSLIWGSTFLAISAGNDALPPLWGASLRLALAAIVLTAITYSTGHRLPRGEALRAAAVFGLFNMGLGFSLLYWGEKHVPSGLAAVMFATIPLNTAFLARWFGLEPLRLFKVLAALVALGGVAVLFAGSHGGSFTPVHLVAVLLAAVFASFSGVALKRGPRQNAIAANAVGAMAGLCVCLPASFLLRESHAVPLTAQALLPVLYLTVAGSVGAYVLYAWLVNQWPLTRISFIAVIVPVVALTLGALFRGERLTSAGILGSVLVFAGLALGILSDRRSHGSHAH